MTTELLRPSSILGEFYIGDKPGTLQYKMEEDTIVRTVSLHDANNDTWTQRYIHKFTYEDLNNDNTDNLRRIMPDTSKAKEGDWQIILLREYKSDNDETVWLKGAMKNKKNGKIALMTSTNRSEQLNRPIKTLAPGWFVGHYRMSANISFWEELVSRM